MPRASEQGSYPKPTTQYRQDPIAIVGLANRLPGNNNNPSQLWDFLERGGVAQNDPPESRFSLQGHYDKSLKPHTIRTPGAMFLESIDPANFDASFFNINRADAIAMDPQQRQLLEVVYEGLENAGLSLETMSNALYGCFVGSYAVGTVFPLPISTSGLTHSSIRLPGHAISRSRRSGHRYHSGCRTRYPQQQDKPFFQYKRCQVGRISNPY